MKTCSLYRSETGTFVLVHVPSGTTLTGDDPAALYDELAAMDLTATATATGDATPRWARVGVIVGLLAVALLPFIWLSALHYTLGRMLDDRQVPALTTDLPDAAEDAAMMEIRALERRVDELETATAAPKRAARKRRDERPPARDPADAPPGDRADGGQDDGEAADAKAP
jgi:hypothetical protein